METEIMQNDRVEHNFPIFEPWYNVINGQIHIWKNEHNESWNCYGNGSNE